MALAVAALGLLLSGGLVQAEVIAPANSKLTKNSEKAARLRRNLLACALVCIFESLTFSGLRVIRSMLLAVVATAKNTTQGHPLPLPLPLPLP